MLGVRGKKCTAKDDECLEIAEQHKAYRHEKRALATLIVTDVHPGKQKDINVLHDLTCYSNQNCCGQNLYRIDLAIRKEFVKDKYCNREKGGGSKVQNQASQRSFYNAETAPEPFQQTKRQPNNYLHDGIDRDKGNGQDAARESEHQAHEL